MPCWVEPGLARRMVWVTVMPSTDHTARISSDVAVTATSEEPSYLPPNT